MIRVTEYRGITIIAHPRNQDVRWSYRSLDGRIRYARTLAMAKRSIDSEHRVMGQLILDRWEVKGTS